MDTIADNNHWQMDEGYDEYRNACDGLEEIHEDSREEPV